MARQQNVKIEDLVNRHSDENIQFNQYLTRDASTEPLFVYQSGVKRSTPTGWLSIPRAYDHYIIHFIVQGNGVFMPGHGDYLVHTGEAFLIRPYRFVTYQADTIDPYTYYWVGFNGTEAEKLVTQCGFSEQTPVIQYDMDGDALRAMKELTEVKLVNSSQEYLLLAHLYRIFASLIGHNQTKNPSSNSDYCYRATCFIRQHLNSSNLSVQEVANYVGIDRSHLYRVFRHTLHQSVKEFILSTRMQKAKELLAHGNDRVSDIASSCGFADVAYFISQFRRVVGTTPLGYRRACSVEKNDDTLK